MRAVTMKKPSGFIHAATVFGLRAAFSAYDLVRKFPGYTASAVAVGGAVGIAALSLGASAAAQTAIFAGALVFSFGWTIGMARYMDAKLKQTNSSAEDYMARLDLMAYHERERAFQKTNIQNLLNEGRYGKAMLLKLVSNRPLTYTSGHEKFRNLRNYVNE